MVGLPGSGKSTWLADRGIAALSTDELRRVLTDDATDQSANALVFELVRRLLRERLRLGRPGTYVDATNLTPNERRAYLRIATAFDAQAEAVWFDVPLEECIRRNAGRARVVPIEAMNRLASKFVAPTLAEGFTRIDVVKPEAAPTG